MYVLSKCDMKLKQIMEGGRKKWKLFQYDSGILPSSGI